MLRGKHTYMEHSLRRVAIWYRSIGIPDIHNVSAWLAGIYSITHQTYDLLPHYLFPFLRLWDGGPGMGSAVAAVVPVCHLEFLFYFDPFAINCSFFLDGRPHLWQGGLHRRAIAIPPLWPNQELTTAPRRRRRHSKILLTIKKKHSSKIDRFISRHKLNLILIKSNLGFAENFRKSCAKNIFCFNVLAKTQRFSIETLVGWRIRICPNTIIIKRFVIIWSIE